MINIVASPPTSLRQLLPEEEIGFGPACWLWDYLRRSGMGGYFLPISGGADSAATATIVGIMCQLVLEEIGKGNQQVLNDVRSVTRETSDYVPKNPRELANRIFYTCYMGTNNSSQETRTRAAHIADQVGSYHLALSIDEIVSSFSTVFAQVKFKLSFS